MTPKLPFKISIIIYRILMIQNIEINLWTTFFFLKLISFIITAKRYVVMFYFMDLSENNISFKFKILSSVFSYIVMSFIFFNFEPRNLIL